MNNPYQEQPSVEVIKALDMRRKKQNELIRLGRLVETTVATEGWQKVGLPLLNKMIEDILGYNREGVWHPGLISKTRKDETVSYYIGYKQGLIDFYNRLYAYPNNIKHYEDMLSEINKEENAKLKIPMMEEN